MEAAVSSQNKCEYGLLRANWPRTVAHYWLFLGFGNLTQSRCNPQCGGNPPKATLALSAIRTSPFRTKQRPLGVPTIRDRTVETAAVLVLEPIFEADLQPEQYAYRPDRSALDAVRHATGCGFRLRRQGMIRIENAIARERERRKVDWNNLGRRAGQWDGVRTCDILTHLRRPSLKIAIVGESVVSYPCRSAAG